jgi:hypothetical protein
LRLLENGGKALGDRDQLYMGIGSLFAIIALLYVMVQTGGFAALTTEAGFLYVTTAASVIFSFGKLIPANFRKYVAAIVLILGSIIFMNLVLGVRLFGLNLLN